MEECDGDECLTKRALVHTSWPVVDPVGDAVNVKTETARSVSHGAFEVAKAQTHSRGWGTCGGDALVEVVGAGSGGRGCESRSSRSVKSSPGS